MKPLAWPNRRRLLLWDHAFTSSLAIFWILKSQTIHDIFPSLLAVQTHNRGFNSCLKNKSTNQPTNHQPTIMVFWALQTIHHRHHDIIRFTHRPPYLHMHGTFRVHVLWPPGRSVWSWHQKNRNVMMLYLYQICVLIFMHTQNVCQCMSLLMMMMMMMMIMMMIRIAFIAYTIFDIHLPRVFPSPQPVMAGCLSTSHGSKQLQAAINPFQFAAIELPDYIAQFHVFVTYVWFSQENSD